jgi:mono/diheme cytochrome c family protein
VASADPLRDFGCIACHGLDGSPAGGKKGPSLAGMGGKMDANAIATALVRAHADTNQNLTLGQIRALARELAAAKSGS